MAGINPSALSLLLEPEVVFSLIKAFKLFDPKYGGTGEQRALLIEKCMEHGPNYYKRN